MYGKNVFDSFKVQSPLVVKDNRSPSFIDTLVLRDKIRPLRESGSRTKSRRWSPGFSRVEHTVPDMALECFILGLMPGTAYYVCHTQSFVVWRSPYLLSEGIGPETDLTALSLSADDFRGKLAPALIIESERQNSEQLAVSDNSVERVVYLVLALSFGDSLRTAGMPCRLKRRLDRATLRTSRPSPRKGTAEGPRGERRRSILQRVR